MSELKDKTVKGVAWSAVERFSAQGIQFVFNILIARILLPEDYGVVAMLNIFLAVSQTFIDSGFANALIRKQDRTEEDFCTVFWFNVGISVVFCLLLWIAAPAIASFYKTPLLTKITRILSLTLVIGAFGAVQGTRLSIRLDFKTRAVISIITITVMGIVGLWMARHGYGVWALVVQNIAGSITRTVFLWLFVKWKPKLIFSKKSFKDMFGFGSKLLVSNLIDALYNNIYTIVIAKVYEPKTLGVYNRAESFASFPSSNFYGIINSVSYPALCSIQNETERLRVSFSKFIRLSAYIVFPMMIGLAIVADPFIRVILTDKWQESIPLLQILCIVLMLYPLDALNISFPNILGRSDLYMKVLIINKIIDIVVLVATIPIGITALCWGRVAAYVVCFFINTYYTGKLVGYGAFAQLKDIFKTIISAAVMGVVVVLATRHIGNDLLKLCVGVASGALFYWLTSVVFKIEEYSWLLEIAKKKGNGTTAESA